MFSAIFSFECPFSTTLWCTFLSKHPHDFLSVISIQKVHGDLSKEKSPHFREKYLGLRGVRLPCMGWLPKNVIVLPSSAFSSQWQEQFYAVHVITCQTWKRFLALDGQCWHGDAGIRSCQFCGICCSNVDHQNCVTRCRAQLLSVEITLFVTVLFLLFLSAALSIANIAFYLLLLPFLILSQ